MKKSTGSVLKSVTEGKLHPDYVRFVLVTQFIFWGCRSAHEHTFLPCATGDLYAFSLIFFFFFFFFCISNSLSTAPGVARPAAQSHDQTYNLDVNVGKTQVAGKDAGGFRCEICDCTLRDSIAWLDHRNGVKHQKNLGFSVRSERASVDDVRQRLQAHKEKHAAESNYGTPLGR
jgi:hypothetical protein